MATLSFRQKIFLSYLVIFLAFVLLLYPILSFFIERIQMRSFSRRTKELVQNLKEAANVPALLEYLEESEKTRFFRVTLFDAEGTPLFNELGEEKFPPEVQEALEKKSGYQIRHSSFFRQEVAFAALPFSFKGKTYVVRAAFPYGDFASLTRDLGIMFTILAISLLLFFILFSLVIMNYFTKPIREIIAAIRPFQLGSVQELPKIKLSRSDEEFGKLAETLNSLARQIKTQIANVTQEKNERNAILESLAEGVIALDRDMNVIYMNRTAEQFLGRNLVRKPLADAEQPAFEALILEAQNKKEIITRVLKPEKSQRRYLDIIAVPRGENEGAILVLQDKTSLHKVMELGRDFIANASHELKTPLAIIQGFAATLHDHPELAPEVHREITAKIVSNCQRMDTLVKNLLTLAALDEGLPASRLQECDLIDLIDQAKQTILTVHPTAKIGIETVGNGPFHLLLDTDLFHQAILNLLDNAVKYSKPPADITVQAEKRGNEMRIKIKDRGIGIPHEDLDRIFERFYAVDKSRSRSLGGSGLGLSIVQRIIERHQGKIDVESVIREGSTFTITLPIRQVEE